MEQDYKPECWKDDVRMNVLFTPFRVKEVNPQAWDGKFEFWKSAFKDWCKSTNRICFNEDSLKTAFERNGRYPQCLQTVVGELLRLKLASRTSDFGKLYDGNGWVSWGVNVLIKRPLVWSLSTLMNTVSKKPDVFDQNCFLFDVVKEKAEEVLTRHQKEVEFESTDHVVETSVLWEQCKDLLHSEADLEIVLIYLKNEKLLATYMDSKYNVVKFKHRNEKTVSEISDVDLDILKLKKARDFLQVRISKLQDDADTYLGEVRQHLKQNAKALAKATLRKKKMLDKVIAKRETSLENLEELLRQIQDVESEKLVIGGYQSGAVGFKNILVEAGITLDNVDDTMSAIQEVFDMHEDIQDTMSQPVGRDTDMSELELELEEILAEPDAPPPPPPPDASWKPRRDEDDEEIARNLRKKIQLNLESDEDITLPEVPTNQPSARKEDALLLED